PLRFGPWNPTELASPLRFDGSEGPLILVHLKPQGPTVMLTLRHGVLTVPVADELSVDWGDAGLPAAPRHLELELDGASARGQERLIVSPGETFTLTPTAHVVEATLRELGGGKQVNTG